MRRLLDICDVRAHVRNVPSRLAVRAGLARSGCMPRLGAEDGGAQRTRSKPTRRSAKTRMASGALHAFACVTSRRHRCAVGLKSSGAPCDGPSSVDGGSCTAGSGGFVPRTNGTCACVGVARGIARSSAARRPRACAHGVGEQRAWLRRPHQRRPRAPPRSRPSAAPGPAQPPPAPLRAALAAADGPRPRPPSVAPSGGWARVQCAGRGTGTRTASPPFSRPGPAATQSAPAAANLQNVLVTDRGRAAKFVANWSFS